ncbi:MAG: LCP family protein [Acidimicrobiia bacterium]
MTDGGDPAPSSRRRRRAERPRRGRRTWPQRLVIGLNLVIIAGLLAVAGGLGYAWSKYTRLTRVVVSSALTARPSSSDEPRNLLIVGVDSAESLGEDDALRVDREAAGVAGLRSDTIMVLRVDPGAETAQLLSLPRDLWVPLAGGGHQRINAALQMGGPRELIDTIESYLAVPIHHYVQVDFAGFLGLVEAIGGVPVYFPYAARDESLGLYIEEPGCITLDPEQALAYARTRHYQYYEDGRWRTDGTGDLGRISRQQDFIRRALGQAIRKGLRNPVTLDRLLDVALSSVQVDDLLTVDNLLDLGRRFRSLDPTEIEMTSVPVVPDTVGGASILRLVDDEAQAILDRFRDVPVAGAEVVAPDAVRVRVRNGSGVGGQAGQAVADLASVGFAVAGRPDNDAVLGLERTRVLYRPGEEARADLVARWLAAGAEQVPTDEDLGADVVVVTGLDYAGVLTSPSPPTSPPPTTTTTPVPPPDAEVEEPAPTTTTTVLGEVPRQPEGVSC